MSYPIKSLFLAVTLITIVMFAPHKTLAVAVTLDINITRFHSNGPIPLPPAPTDPVIGTFVYEASDIDSQIISISSISLTIDGYSYTLAETGFTNIPSTNSSSFGGTVSGLGALPLGRNDFHINFSRGVTTELRMFAFTTTSYPNHAFVGEEGTLTRSVAPTVVPEPSTYALFAMGIIGLGIAHRRRKTRS